MWYVAVFFAGMLVGVAATITWALASASSENDITRM